MEVSKLIFIVAVLEATLWAQPNLCLDQHKSLSGILQQQNALLESLDHTKNQGVAAAVDAVQRLASLAQLEEGVAKAREAERVATQQRERAEEAAHPAEEADVALQAEQQDATQTAGEEAAADKGEDEADAAETSAAVPVLDAGQAKMLTLLALFIVFAATATTQQQQQQATAAEQQKRTAEEATAGQADDDDDDCHEPEAKRPAKDHLCAPAAAKAKAMTTTAVAKAQAPFQQQQQQQQQQHTVDTDGFSIVMTPSDASDAEERSDAEDAESACYPMPYRGGVSPFALTPSANDGVVETASFAAASARIAERTQQQQPLPQIEIPARRVSMPCSLPQALHGAFRHARAVYHQQQQQQQQQQFQEVEDEEQLMPGFVVAAHAGWLDERFHADGMANPGTLPATIPLSAEDAAAFFDPFLEEPVLC